MPEEPLPVQAISSDASLDGRKGQVDPGLGLALSGGGFRATLFHLGVVHFLLDAGLLSKITHICAVSGGSVLAAHLVLNWETYTKSQETFRLAAKQLIELVQFDLRGRILRRVHRSPTILLQRYYSTRIYDSKQLKDLKDQGRPKIYLLATNLTIGKPCCFTANGLFVDIADLHGKPVPAEDQPIALAVAASSAFTAFFPPVLLTPGTLRVQREELKHDIFVTDGGVYDNLGVRTFRELLKKDLFDSILVSDASLKFDWSEARKAPRFVGIATTAWRAYDISSHRIYEIDSDSAHRQGEFTFIDIQQVLEKKGDPQIPEPSVQRQLKGIRSDLDRFSDEEIVALVQHGYCVARDTLSTHSKLKIPKEAFSRDIWNPLPRKVKLDSKSLYEARHRHLRLFSLKDFTNPVMWLLIFLLTSSSIWWYLESRRSKPAQISLTTLLPVISSPDDDWLTRHKWLEPYVTRFSLEGREEEKRGAITDYKVIRMETKPFRERTVNIDLDLRLLKNYQIRAIPFRVRSTGDRQWYDPLPVRYIAGSGSVRLGVPECEAGDSILILGLLSTTNEQGIVDTLDNILSLEVNP